MRFTQYLDSTDYRMPFVCHFVNDIPWRQMPAAVRMKDANYAWLLTWCMVTGKKVPLGLAALYFCTRNPFARKALFAVLKVLGKGDSVVFLKKCAVHSMVEYVAHIFHQVKG